MYEEQGYIQHLTLKFALIQNKFKVESEESLREHSIKHNFAFGIERLLSGYYAIGDYFKDDVVGKYVVMTEDLYRQYTCMQLRKSSILLPSIDGFLLRVTETGLLNHWEAETSRQHLNFKVQIGLKMKSKETHVVSLQLGHVKGVFLLWGLGLFMSLLKFIHELETGKTAKKRLKMKEVGKIETPKMFLKWRRKIPIIRL